MRVDYSVEMNRFQRGSCCYLSSDVHGSDTADSDGCWSHEQRNTEQRRQGNESRWRTKQSNTASMSKMRKYGSQQIALISMRRADNVEKSFIWRARVDLLEQRSQRQREAARKAREARVQVQSKRVGIVVRMIICLPNVPRRRSMRWKI